MKSKKLVSIFLCMLLLLTVLAGCAGNENGAGKNTNVQNEAQSEQTANNGAKETKEPVQLTMWGGVPPESGPQAVVDVWNEENPDIQVEYIRFVNDDDGNLKLDTAMLTQQGVDLYVNYTLTQVEKRVEAGLALDLSQYSDYNIDEKMGADAALWKVNDKYYGIPTKKNAFFVALNKDLLDEANLPVPTEWTWEDMREYSQKLMTNDRYGLVQHLEPFSDPIDSVLDKYGVTTADGTSNYNHPLIKDWMETLNAMMHDDKSTPPLGEQLTTQMPADGTFLSGKAAMINIGEWLIRSSNNTTDFPRDFKIAFAPVPRMTEEASDFTTRGGLGDFISINAESPNQEAAWEFLKWYSDGGMAPMAAGGRLPASKDVDMQMALDSLLGDMAGTYDVESLQYVLYGDDTPTYVRNASQQVLDLRQQEYEKYFLGAQSVDETLDSIVKRHNEILK